MKESNVFNEYLNPKLVFKLEKASNMNPKENLLFKTNPVQLFNDHSSTSIVSNNSFGRQYDFTKCNLTDTFTINEENFVSWTGSKDEQEFYPIHIYNHSRKKNHQIIQRSKSTINALSFYCTSSGEEILYSGDDNGRVGKSPKKPFRKN